MSEESNLFDSNWDKVMAKHAKMHNTESSGSGEEDEEAAMLLR